VKFNVLGLGYTLIRMDRPSVVLHAPMNVVAGLLSHYMVFACIGIHASWRPKKELESRPSLCQLSTYCLSLGNATGSTARDLPVSGRES
jgi:hypothetical protein